MSFSLLLRANVGKFWAKRYCYREVEMAGFNAVRLELESIARSLALSQSKKLMRGIKAIYLANARIPDGGTIDLQTCSFKAADKGCKPSALPGWAPSIH